MMRKGFPLRAFIFLIAFLFFVSRVDIPGLSAGDIPGDATDSDPLIDEAIEHITFYSTFHYQTVDEDELNELSTGLYLPVRYGAVSIDWDVDSPYLGMTGMTTIEINNGTGTDEIEVIEVLITDTPSVWAADASFVLRGTFAYGDEIETHMFEGGVAPVMGDGFFEGAQYTLVRYGRLFIEGALVTLLLSVSGTIAGFLLGMVLVFLRLGDISVTDGPFVMFLKQSGARLSKAYITLFRGTPMIVQASFFWYGLGLFGDALLCGLFVVSLNTAAYVAEILRGGIQAVDPGQKEAARSLGMSHLQAMLHVVVPQGVRNALPAIGNELIINIKDTAVLSVIGIYELFNQTRRIAGFHYRQLEAYFVVALIYLVLTYGMGWVLRYAESKGGLTPQELTSSN